MHDWAYALTVTIALASGFVGGMLTSLIWLVAARSGAQGNSSGRDGPMRVQRLTLVDEAGRERALLRFLDSEVTLLLTDETMSWRIRLSAGEQGPYLRFVEGMLTRGSELGSCKTVPQGWNWPMLTARREPR